MKRQSILGYNNIMSVAPLLSYMILYYLPHTMHKSTSAVLPIWYGVVKSERRLFIYLFIYLL